VRITAQLIRASDGVQVWSDIYDRKLNDIFKLQSEISTTVARALNSALSITPTGGAQTVSHGTTNVEAYNLLLQGNYFFFRGNSGDNAKAVNFLKQALEVDPRYAVAWARLARVYAYRAYENSPRPRRSQQEMLFGRLAIDPGALKSLRSATFPQVVETGRPRNRLREAVALDPMAIGERAQSNIAYLKAVIRRLRRRNCLHVPELERNPLNTSSLSDLIRINNSMDSLPSQQLNLASC
jgi:hypothetical protein